MNQNEIFAYGGPFSYYQQYRQQPVHNDIPNPSNYIYHTTNGKEAKRPKPRSYPNKTSPVTVRPPKHRSTCSNTAPKPAPEQPPPPKKTTASPAATPGSSTAPSATATPCPARKSLAAPHPNSSPPTPGNAGSQIPVRSQLPGTQRLRRPSLRRVPEYLAGEFEGCPARADCLCRCSEF